jgi:hypothetical protein
VDLDPNAPNYNPEIAALNPNSNLKSHKSSRSNSVNHNRSFRIKRGDSQKNVDNNLNRSLEPLVKQNSNVEGFTKNIRPFDIAHSQY